MQQLPNRIRNWIPYIIPILLSIFQLTQSYLDSPAYYTRIDAEFVCLLNGLNIALLNFDNIGYFVHPGTPFIIITGVFIRIIHVFIGKDQLFTDLISHTETYLRLSSSLLMILTFTILVWGGKKVYRKGENLLGLIIIQSSFLLSEICLHLPTRYTADRLLPILVFIFAIYTIEYLRENIRENKYALLCGLFLGIGLATKLNFLPIIVIPFFLIRKIKPIIVFVGSLLLSTFISLLPVISKLKYFKNFILAIYSHEGMYGQGKSQIINIEMLKENINTIVRYNSTFTILLLASLVLILFFLFKPDLRKKNQNQYYLFIAFIFSSIIQILMVSKHFKDYYLAPILAILGLILFQISDILFHNLKIKKSILSIVLVLTLIVLITPSFKLLRHADRTIKRIEERKLSAKFLLDNRKPTDWLFTEASWKSDPTIENGLLWGISYVARRNDYIDYFKEVYPRVITFEGPDNKISQFRCGDADEQEILKSGDDILLVSIPGDQTPQMIEKLNSIASLYNSVLQYDTIFVNKQNNDIIIRASHLFEKN
ncbi:glycosyltransferase family 39 protein [Sunxiuqinia sp. A32]|uniref:glycosyltransferase family 39 protein n=1 Tax=Sunxiuqinia sp. A32 TaxID=3461496 RepID=UPI0040467D07